MLAAETVIEMADASEDARGVRRVETDIVAIVTMMTRLMSSNEGFRT